MEKLFLILVTMVIPALGAVYALYKRSLIPFVLGALAFTISQVLIRLPLLNWISEHSVTYQLWSVTQPFLIVAILSFSAGIFEELARWLAMRYVMRQRDLKAGLAFGIGHGGIEAFLIVGLPVLLSSNLMMQAADYYLSGFERLCAMTVHICLSLIVLTAVKKGKLVYVLYAILFHGLINFAISSLSMLSTIIVAELVMLLATVILVIITYFIMRKGGLR